MESDVLKESLSNDEIETAVELVDRQTIGYSADEMNAFVVGVKLAAYALGQCDTQRNMTVMLSVIVAAASQKARSTKS